MTNAQLSRRVVSERAKIHLQNVMKKRSYTTPRKVDYCLALRRRERVKNARRIAGSLAVTALGVGAMVASSRQKARLAVDQSDEAFRAVNRETGIRIAEQERARRDQALADMLDLEAKIMALTDELHAKEVHVTAIRKRAREAQATVDRMKTSAKETWRGKMPAEIIADAAKQKDLEKKAADLEAKQQAAGREVARVANELKVAQTKLGQLLAPKMLRK